MENNTRFFFFVLSYWTKDLEGKVNLSITSDSGFPSNSQVKELAQKKVAENYDVPHWGIRVIIEGWYEMTKEDFKSFNP